MLPMRPSTMLLSCAIAGLAASAALAPHQITPASRRQRANPCTDLSRFGPQEQLHAGSAADGSSHPAAEGGYLDNSQGGADDRQYFGL